MEATNGRSLVSGLTNACSPGSCGARVSIFDEAPYDPTNKHYQPYDPFFLPHPHPTMMKGLFKGLRCFFDTDDEKEPEIVIGNPTDVKHVAHIGCDGPSTPAPSWMSGYQNGADSQTNAGSKDVGTGTASSSRQAKTKQSKRQASNISPGDDSTGNPKPRKNKTTNSNSESAPNDSSRTRRIKNSICGSESPAQDSNVKKTRKKKGDGTTRSSKTRNKDASAKDADSECSDGVCQKPLN